MVPFECVPIGLFKLIRLVFVVSLAQHNGSVVIAIT